MSNENPTEQELIEHDLLDPALPGAEAQRELVAYLVSIGATLEDLVAYRDELPGLGTVVTTRPGPPRYTSVDVEAKTGLSLELLKRLWRASGFPDPPEDVPSFSDADVEMLQLIAAAAALFGEEAVIQLSRVIGSSMAKIADAAVSSFLVNIEVPIVEREPAAIAIAKANYAAASLLPGLSRAMDALLRHHILAARRSLLAWQQTGLAGHEVQLLAVGFVDLVGSTALAAEVPAADLGRALTAFENLAADEVVARRGRVVKLIGDEVMFVAPDAATACEIALTVVGAIDESELLPAARAGVASGEVLTRDGDYFGPVVNLAARVVKAADPGAVFVPEDLRADLEASGFRLGTAGTHTFKGFEAGVPLLAVSRR